MLAEALGPDHIHFGVRDEDGAAGHAQSQVPATPQDPMLIEIALLSASSSVAEVASPPHLDYSTHEMVATAMAACDSSAMADLETVRFDVQDPSHCLMSLMISTM